MKPDNVLCLYVWFLLSYYIKFQTLVRRCRVHTFLNLQQNTNCNVSILPLYYQWIFDWKRFEYIHRFVDHPLNFKYSHSNVSSNSQLNIIFWINHCICIHFSWWTLVHNTSDNHIRRLTIGPHITFPNKAEIRENAKWQVIKRYYHIH